MSLVQISRSAVSAAVATVADFAFVVLLVSALGVRAGVATALGCLLGACVNFTMNRAWTFESDGPLPGQAVRYALVSGASLILNAVGVDLLVHTGLLDYRLVWWLVRGLVWLGWNYPLHRFWVFR
jgi:putative flippase GtrA